MIAVDYWADYVCPWCYLGLDRARHLTEEHGAVVTWHPFQLGGGPAARKPPDVDAYLRDELAAAGLAVVPPVRRSASAAALALSAWAQPLPPWPALHRGLYAAYWAEGRDIGDPAVLVDVAAGVGIDGGEAVAAGWGAERLAASREQALEMGIAAVPGWWFGDGVVVAGAQPRAVFDKVVGRLVRAAT